MNIDWKWAAVLAFIAGMMGLAGVLLFAGGFIVGYLASIQWETTVDIKKETK